ncbi:substrate-binding periplasmic protein [Methylobacterium haplocladii]|uniref:Amino acid ABC transporter substrate-binding protein n=2 Tax=Methylobacterium haplocladii TaxID=1176176 RepID=A0A512IJ18_9HYPH|nr:transporter substrate-binding domain-containing protein [Methylobacterium haplocladii]GEO97696.1 amino acid ABC transporter substrate-binding protein [Methylobacterium haplocladii]GLS57426.1 amino acid ABC transporter substrate-binding protein [Methylobacterium haplocladii]
MVRGFLFSVAAVALATAPVAARPLDEVASDGTLRVVLYEQNAPFSDLKDGKPYGIEVDLAEALAAALKVKAEIRLVDAGENVDGDFRLNLWKGDLAGSQLGDLMLHVPVDKLLAIRNEQIFMTRPYYDQRLAFAVRKSAVENFETVGDIGTAAIDVEGNSASDAMLLTAQGGQLRPNLKHFKSFDEAAKAFLAGDAPILAGSRAGIESALFAAKSSKDEIGIRELRLGGPVKLTWDLGGAVKSDSRDLAYAVGDAITAMTENGTLKAIFDKHGVEFSAPKGY